MEFLIYLFKSAAILSLFYGVYILILRQDTFFSVNRFYLISGILASIVLPLIEIPVTTYREMPAVTLSYMSSAIDTTSNTTVNVATTATSIDPWAFIVVLYVSGMLFMLGRIVIELSSLLRQLQNCSAEKRNGFYYIHTSEAIAPFSFFSYIVYNPTLHTEEELDMILHHERIHASQWHSLDILIAHFLRAIHWFHPIAWWYKKSIEANLEFIADERTAEKVASKKEYQLTLIKTTSKVSFSPVSVNFYQSFIKKRIVMLNKDQSTKHHQLKLCLILPLLACFMWSFNTHEVVVYTDAAEEILAPLSSDTNGDLSTKNKASIVLDDATEKGNKNDMDQATLSATKSEESKTAPQHDLFSISTETNDQNNVPMIKRIQFPITKNTTNAQLQAYSTELKEKYDMEVSFSAERNAAGEIVGISIIYEGNGNNGRINNNSGGPIPDSYFYIDDETGGAGFLNEGSEERMKEMQDRMRARKLNMEERRAQREVSRKDAIEERKLMREEMQEQRREMRNDSLYEDREFAEMHREMTEEHIERAESHRAKMEARQMEVKEWIKARRHDQRLHRDSLQAFYHERADMDAARAHAEARRAGVRSNQFQFATGSYASGHRMLRLDKNTSDATLEQWRSELDQQGVDFTFKRVKRNALGEIISIKIVVDDGNGSKMTKSIRSDNEDPIDPITISF